jgi:hypothetical protein
VDGSPLPDANKRKNPGVGALGKLGGANRRPLLGSTPSALDAHLGCEIRILQTGRPKLSVVLLIGFLPP